MNSLAPQPGTWVSAVGSSAQEKAFNKEMQLLTIKQAPVSTEEARMKKRYRQGTNGISQPAWDPKVVALWIHRLATVLLS